MVDILERATIEAEQADMLARAATMQARWRAYYGQFPRPLKVEPGKPDDNVVVNKARVIVDKGVSFLFGQDIRFALDNDEQAESAPEAYLSGAWDRNKRMTTLHKLALNGAVCGHAFLKIVPDSPLTAPYPRLIVLDPETVTVYWDDDDIERVRGYKIQYNATDEGGRPIVRRQLLAEDASGLRWSVIEQYSYLSAKTWITTAESVWPYPFAPIADCQNLPAPNEYWGISDLEDDIMGLNRNLNFNLSNWLRVLRFFAHPKVWGRGFNSNNMHKLSTAVDDLVVIPSDTGVLEVLKANGDSVGANTMHRTLAEAIHEASRVPEIATGKMENVGALSGVALQILYQPLLEKTETKRRLYGDFIREINRRLLVIGGMDASKTTIIHWPDMLPANDLEQAQTLLIHENLGASQDTILERLGYDPEHERALREATVDSAGEQLLTAFERGAGVAGQASVQGAQDGQNGPQSGANAAQDTQHTQGG